ncbi:hypothetical protein D3C80_2164980 [compost metagenome]
MEYPVKHRDGNAIQPHPGCPGQVFGRPAFALSSRNAQGAKDTGQLILKVGCGYGFQVLDV